MRYEDCIKYKIFKIYGNFKYMRIVLNIKYLRYMGILNI